MNRPIQLLLVQDSLVVDAIITFVTEKHLEDATSLWEPLLRGTRQEDEYWNWVKKSRMAKLLPGDELYAIECDGITQGLIMLDVLKKRCQIQSQLRRRLVYISALATAPWNRPAITNPPTYKGGNLIDFAIARSYELGYQGRIGLHADDRCVRILQKAASGTAPIVVPIQKNLTILCILKHYGRTHDPIIKASIRPFN